MIGYAARVGVGPLAVHVSETLRWQAGDPAAQNHTVLGGALPVAATEGVDWSSPALDASGRWRPFVSGMPAEILYEDPAGRVEWTCFCPAARTTMSIGSDHYEGLGYCERLVLTLPPAKLPLRELHWGRFIADTQSCVWIHWLGPVERSWCFHNGQAVPAATRVPHGLSWNGHRLQLNGGTILRSGRIADTAFQDARWLRWLLPAVVRDLDETKWCSVGTLTDARGQRHSGWAIHEVVKFA